MAAITLKINGQSHAVNVDPSTPLLWVLRDVLGMTGTKFGCGIEVCGACTVLLGGSSEKSCNLTVSEASKSAITTIEGVAATKYAAVQQAWIAQQVPQCGYCQSGMILLAVELLSSTLNPTDAEINAAMGNICVCGTYNRIRAAIHAAATTLRGAGVQNGAGSIPAGNDGGDN